MERRRTLAFLLAASLAAAPLTAGSAPQYGASPIQQIVAAHERTRAQLAPADRRLLDSLADRLRVALPKNARLPEDARSLIAAAARGALSPAEVGALADDSSAQLLQATQQMQETQMSFNLQYLQLQSQMQNENRAYTAVSNIMKTKHDTVKNSIGNVR